MAEHRVAARYAEALFAVAEESKVVDAISDDLRSITEAIRTDPQFKLFLNHPSVGREERVKVLETVFSDKATALTMQLIRLLLEKRREGIIPELSQAFDRIRRDRYKVMYAEVTSAQALSEDEIKALEAKLAKSSGKKVEATYSVDSNLIGGIIVGIGNHVLDGSLRGSLDRMRDHLLYNFNTTN